MGSRILGGGPGNGASARPGKVLSFPGAPVSQATAQPAGGTPQTPGSPTGGTIPGQNWQQQGQQQGQQAPMSDGGHVTYGDAPPGMPGMPAVPMPIRVLVAAHNFANSLPWWVTVGGTVAVTSGVWWWLKRK